MPASDPFECPYPHRELARLRRLEVDIQPVLGAAADVVAGVPGPFGMSRSMRSLCMALDEFTAAGHRPPLPPTAEGTRTP